MRASLPVFAVLSFMVCTNAWASDTCPAPLLSLAADGSVTGGSKLAVHAAAQRGDALRIGWRIVYGEGRDRVLQHWADAGFVTVFEGEVFAQIDAIHRQSPRVGTAHVELARKRELWHASIGTDGRLVGRSERGAPVEARVAQTWCLGGEAALRCATPAWRTVYHHDPDGARIDGDKATLFAAIRRGDPIRLVWGMSAEDRGISVEHVAEPVFVSIASNREAYAQLPEHGLQQAYHAPGQAAIADASMLWRAVMGTDGRFDALAADRTDNDPVKRFPQRAAIRWLAYAPDPRCDARPVPTVAVPGGARLVPNASSVRRRPEEG